MCSTFIILVPKKNQSTRVRNYIPINVVKTSYVILLMVLRNRLFCGVGG
jgi:hypothetical protein